MAGSASARPGRAHLPRLHPRARRVPHDDAAPSDGGVAGVSDGLAVSAATVAFFAAGRGGSKPSASVEPNPTEVSPAGDIPDDQVFIPFAGQGFSVKVPEGWSRTSGSA